MSVAPYLLRLDPIVKEKVWGGRKLEAFGKRLPDGALVGETWEVADLAATAPGGGGGGEARSRIVNGALAGTTLHDALERWGEALLGSARPAAGGFPLLVKLLDAREHLSVQVHPSEAFVRSDPAALVKHECWYVLEADPGAVIFAGLAPGVDRERLAADSAAGRLVDDLLAVPAIPGDCHHLPSGTVHALGAGIVVAEVQSPSDTTFRLYDWAAEYGRAGRELHTESALACALAGPAPRPVRREPGSRTALLARTPSFAMWEVAPGAGATEPAPSSGSAAVVVLALSGRHAVETPGAERVEIAVGDAVVVPAALAHDLRLAYLADGTMLVAEPAGAA